MNQRNKPLFLRIEDLVIIRDLLTEIQAQDKEDRVQTPDQETKVLWKVNKIIDNIEKAQVRNQAKARRIIDGNGTL